MPLLPFPFSHCPPCPSTDTAAVKVATFLTMPSSEPLVTTNRAKQEEHMQVGTCSWFVLCDGQGGSGRVSGAE